MKNIKKIILIVFAIMICVTSYGFAKQIGEFTEFKITYRGERTGFLLKEGPNGSPFILNLYPSRDLRPMAVKYWMENVNGRRRSDTHRLECGYRNENSNWASQGYSYALKMARENWWDKEAYITGSWSPDK